MTSRARNIVLLQPRVGDMDEFRDRPTLPLGLLAAAAHVWHDTEVRLVDQRCGAAGSWRARLAAALDSRTVAVGITATTGRRIRDALEMAQQVRRIGSTPLVWGGVHASLLPEQTAHHELVDYVVEGEGEETFATLVRELASGRDGAGIPGVTDGRSRTVRRTAPAPLIEPERLPVVPYHLVDVERYMQTYRGQRMLFYQSSRGCPHGCSYCYNPVVNRRRWRALPAARVVDELLDLRERYDFSLVYFVDDDFFIDHRRAMTLLAELHRHGLGTSLQGVDVTTLARMSDAELDSLERMGLERISVGVESGSDRVRAEVLNKKGDMALVRRQLARFRGRSVHVLCSFILGLPGETEAETQASIRAALDTLALGDNFRVPQFYNFVPYPGTDLFARMQRAGVRFPSRLEDWADHEYDFAVALPDRSARRDRLERVSFLSKFLDHKEHDFAFAHPLMQSLYHAYQPVAKMRLQRGWLKPLPERSVYRLLKRAVGARH